MAQPNYANRGLSAFDEFSSDMERVFDSLLGRTVGTAIRGNHAEKYLPTLDVSESAEGFEVVVDLPGVKPEEVKVEMHEGRLVISGQRQSATQDKEKNYHRIERSSGTFVRTLSLPTEVDMDRIEARYEHGVLHISLPKSEKQQPRKIEIRTGASS